MSEQERIYDRAYFHTGNSGFTISFMTRTRPGDNEQPFMEIHQSMHGVSSTYQIEIINPAMLDAIIRMADSFRKHVGQHPHLGEWSRDPVSVIDGIEYIPIHREFITGPTNTLGYTVGHNLMDINSKQIVETRMLEPEEWIEGGGSGSSGNEPRFTPEQIGHEIGPKGKILDAKLPLHWTPKQSVSSIYKDDDVIDSMFVEHPRHHRGRRPIFSGDKD